MERNIMENFRRYQQQCTTLFGKLDEQNRRHVAGLIALTLGHGGGCFVADLTGLDRPCTINSVVSRGKHELLDNLSDCPTGRQRKAGAGRRFEEHVPTGGRRDSPLVEASWYVFVQRRETADDSCRLGRRQRLPNPALEKSVAGILQ